MAAVNALTADGLFIGQSQAFFTLLIELPQAADAAHTGTGVEAGDKRRSPIQTNNLSPEASSAKWSMRPSTPGNPIVLY